MGTARFPRTDNTFNNYIIEAVPYLNTHAARLMVSPGNLADLNLLYTDPAGEGWDVIFPASQSPNLRTATITAKKDTLKEELTNTLRSIYADIPESALTQDDRDVLRIYARDEVPSTRPAITTAPFVDLMVQDGARAKITCRVEGDGGRASMHPDADFIEVMYELVNINSNPPDAPGELIDRHTSTSAIFTMEFGVGNAGKRLYAFVRYANLADPTKSGPWSQVMTLVVSD